MRLKGFDYSSNGGYFVTICTHNRRNLFGEIKNEKMQLNKSGAPPKSGSSLISGFKSSATTRINRLNQTPGQKIWQRGFYDHIVRNENELYRIRQYIIDNPAKWQHDRMNKNSLLKEPTAVYYPHEPWMI
jgi:hypothetical protein